MIHKHIDIREDGSSYVEASLFEPEFATNVTRVRPAMIILPGGCYLYKSHREGDPVAARFAGMGYHTFVFQYASYWKKKYLSENETVELVEDAHYPEQVIDLFKIIAMLRDHAEEWYIDPDQIYVAGFSAGGHIAAAAAVKWDDPELLRRAGITDPRKARPDAAVLCYPMLEAELIRVTTKVPEEMEFQARYLVHGLFGCDNPDESMYREVRLVNHITPETPPVFIWHTFEDMTTSALESTRFVEELIKNKVRCEFHLFETGAHGASLCDVTTARDEGDIKPSNALWPQMADRFLKNRV